MLRKQLLWLFGLLFCALFIGSAIAETEKYDYDPLGRLIRVTKGTNATDYKYDAAGNILEVKSGAAVAAPVVTSVSPSALRRGESKAFTITGTGFTGANIVTPEPALSIANLQASSTEFKFTLAASTSATLGPQPITISTSSGNAAATITVNPLLPKVNVDPAPLAIPPDSVSRLFTIRLSNTDTVDHAIALSASNNNIAVSPASVSIPAGQLSITANIKGISAGQATINLTSATLGTTLVPVFITSEFVGITTSMASNLGVVLEATAGQNQTQITPVVSQRLGVLIGSAIRSVDPDRFALGTSSTLTIKGVGLETAQTVTVEPNTGITLGAMSIATDGSTITMPITVANDAPITQRRLVVKGVGGVAFAVANPWSDRITVVRPEPQIESISPLFGTPGTTLQLTVRGKNLQDASAILFNPSTGVVTDANPVVSSDGTSLTAGVTLALGAPIGDYAVAVTTPGGTSSTTAGQSNTFKVVNEIQYAVTPIVAPSLGIVLQDSAAPVQSTIGLASPTIGIAMGPVATAISPNVGIIGQNVTLTIQGTELTGVTSVDLVPNTGVTVGAVTVAIDGKSVSVPLTIAQDAAQTPRRVKVMAGTSEIQFAPSSASQFQVSLPLPEIDSIEPINLQVGQAPAAFTVRGRNFQNATQVKVTPANDLTISTPPNITADGTGATVNISAAANAALGERLVTIVTPAGESSLTLGPTNTIKLTSSAGATYTPIIAPLVGIVKLETGGGSSSTSIGPIVSPNLGIVLEEVPVPVSTTTTQFGNAVGVAFGPTALSLDANGFAPGFNGSITVSGNELSSVTSIAVTPSTGINFGTPTVSSNGKQVSVTMTVDASTTRGPRMLKLNTAGGSVNFADPATAQIRVGPGTPLIDSIEPILAKQGDLVTMTVRGSNLFDAQAVTATPSTGITFIPGSLTVNTAGTEVKVSFTIDASAPLGSRVIQVLVPGATSDATPAPANTFTVFPP